MELLLQQKEVCRYMLKFGGQVGAGKSVVQFPQPSQIGKIKEIILPRLPCTEKDAIVYEACGDSLAGVEIRDGDFIVATTKFEAADVRPDRIFILKLYGSEIVAKYFVQDYGGKTVTLIGAPTSGKYKKQVVPVEELEIIAMVVGCYKSFL